MKRLYLVAAVISLASCTPVAHGEINDSSSVIRLSCNVSQIDTDENNFKPLYGEIKSIYIKVDKNNNDVYVLDHGLYIDDSHHVKSYMVDDSYLHLYGDKIPNSDAYDYYTTISRWNGNYVSHNVTNGQFVRYGGMCDFIEEEPKRLF